MFKETFVEYVVRPLGLFLLFSGCATQSPVLKEVSHEEIVRRSRALGIELATQFETHLKFRKDSEVTNFLQNLAQTMVVSNPDLDGIPANVSLIESRAGKWSSYALPGNHVYLSSGILKKCSYENELAAVLAIQFGHVIKRDLLRHLKNLHAPFHGDTSTQEEDESESSIKESLTLLTAFEPGEYGSGIDFFSPSGVFTFSAVESVSAIKSAVEVLYRSGYDPRGLVSVLQLFLDNPKYSPYEINTVKKLVQNTREEIASQTPLRNPVVRSQAFLKIQKRIQQL